MLRDVLEPIRDPQATLPILLPGATRLHQRSATLTHGEHRFLEAGWQRLAGELVEQRLPVEGVQMAGAALHETENHALSMTEVLRNAR
jgi:hypothetical protein